jgi:hypothetical protein
VSLEQCNKEADDSDMGAVKVINYGICHLLEETEVRTGKSTID